MLRKAVITPLIALLLVAIAVTKDNLDMSPIDRFALPYRFEVFSWELKHLTQQWSNRILQIIIPKSNDRTENLYVMEEYFRISEQLGLWDRKRQLDQLRISNDQLNQMPGGVIPMQEGSRDLYKYRETLRPVVESTLEAEISDVLSQQGLKSQVGFIFPPVDLSLANPPKLLVISPRDQIKRSHDILVIPDLAIAEIEYIEDTMVDSYGVSAIVVDISGIATYPTMVRPNSSLLSAARLAAHEWLHTYWFFYPLGQNYWKSPDMTILNETAATIAGDELGNLVYKSITGETVATYLHENGLTTTTNPFDYAIEMRETRINTEELLDQGLIDKAEKYMEAQRRQFVENGFPIRKLNQAFFAFHGTYATSAASISPVDKQIEKLRNSKDTVGDFIRAMRDFSNYKEFHSHIETEL